MSKPKNMTPEQEADWKAKKQEYNRAYKSTPEAQARRRQLDAEPVAKRRAQERRDTPIAKAKAAERARKRRLNPETKEKQRETNRAYRARAEAKAKDREYARNYRERPEVKAKKREHDAKYRVSPAARARALIRRSTEEYKARNQARVKAFRETPAGAAYYRAYLLTPEGKAKTNAWRATPEGREYMRKYKATEEYKAQQKEYAATPEGQATRTNSKGKRRARERSLRVGDPKEIAAWIKQWKALPVVFCHWCAGAFKPNKCHADHVMPLAKGGAHSRDNLVIACAGCNQRKNAKHPDEWVKELAARP